MGTLHALQTYVAVPQVTYEEDTCRSYIMVGYSASTADIRCGPRDRREQANDVSGDCEGVENEGGPMKRVCQRIEVVFLLMDYVHVCAYVHVSGDAVRAFACVGKLRSDSGVLGICVHMLWVRGLQCVAACAHAASQPLEQTYA